MQFSDTSARQGIIQACEDELGLGSAAITGNNALFQRFTRTANQVMRELLAIILKVTGPWQFDDSNQTTLPSATQNLTATRDYPAPPEGLRISKVLVQDQGGMWHEVKPSPEDVTDTTLTGIPEFYYLTGTTIRFDRTPTVPVVGGMKVYFDRDMVNFTTASTTQEPGFASHLHYAVVVGDCYYYLASMKAGSAEAREMDKRYTAWKALVEEHFTNRHKDFEPQITVKRINCR